MNIAKERGIDISFYLSEEDMGHPNVARIEAYGIHGAHVVVVGRSLGGGRIMVTNIDGYDVEITGEEYTLLTRHYDKPGWWQRCVKSWLKRRLIFPPCVFSAKAREAMRS